MIGRCLSQLYSRLKQTVCGTLKFLYHAIVITVLGFYIIHTFTSNSVPTSHISRTLDAYGEANGNNVNVLRHMGQNNVMEIQAVLYISFFLLKLIGYI